MAKLISRLQIQLTYPKSPEFKWRLRRPDGFEYRLGSIASLCRAASASIVRGGLLVSSTLRQIVYLYL